MKKILLASMLVLAGCKTEVGDSVEITCAPPVTVNYSISVTHCTHADGMPMMITHPKVLPGNNSLPVVLKLHGYGGALKACTDPAQNPTADKIIIYNCSDPFNDVRSWWGPLGGTNDAGRRLAISINKAYELFGSSINMAAGVSCVGVSMGGGGCILQSMIMPDGLWRYAMNVDAVVPHTLIAENNYGIGQQAAWGYYPARSFDVRRLMANGALAANYYRVQGHTNDSLGVFDTDFLRYCDQYKIRCFGLWAMEGHSHACGLNIDCLALGRQRPAVVFTESSANVWGPVGHYNLGLTSWIGDGRVWVRYQQYTNLGAGLPDMPETVNVNVTVDGVTTPVSISSGQTLEIPR